MSIGFNTGEFLWEEKYRPNSVADIALPKDLKTLFMNMAETKQLQNLVLYSENPGSGKTTTSLALCNDIGCTRPLFINGSLQTSVEDIRSDVVDYTSSVSLVDNSHKVVIIDESERLSIQALESLKGLMEKVSKGARFIFTTNNVDTLPDAIISRCTAISFEFDEAETLEINTKIFERITHILKNEGVEYELPALAQIIKMITPDTRKIISELQRLSTIHKKIDMSVVGKVSVIDYNKFGNLIKNKDYVGLKLFIMEHHRKMVKGFFSKMFSMIEPMLEDQSSPILVQILGSNQKDFNKVPDLYIFWLNVVVEILIQCNFKE